MDRNSIKLRLTKIGFSNEIASELSFAYIHSKLKDKDIDNIVSMTLTMINEWYNSLNNRIDIILNSINNNEWCNTVNNKIDIVLKSINNNNTSFNKNDTNKKNKIITKLMLELNKIFDIKSYLVKNEFFESIILDIKKNMKNILNEKNLENWIDKHNFNTKNEYIANYIKIIKNEINMVLKNIHSKVNEIANNDIYNLEKKLKDILTLVTYEYI